MCLRHEIALFAEKTEIKNRSFRMRLPEGKELVKSMGWGGGGAGWAGAFGNVFDKKHMAQPLPLAQK